MKFKSEDDIEFELSSKLNDSPTRPRSGSNSRSGTHSALHHLPSIVESIFGNVTDALNDLVDVSVIDFDESDLSPQVNMALREQIVKYVTLGVTKAITGQ